MSEEKKEKKKSINPEKIIKVETYYIEDSMQKNIQEHTRYTSGEKFYTGVARVDFPPRHPNMPPERNSPMNFKFPPDVKDVVTAFQRFDEIGEIKYKEELALRMEQLESVKKGIHLPDGSVAPAKKG